MRKTFRLNVENKNKDRLLDAIKHEIKKYIARERRKELPTGYDHWFFDCSLGENAESLQSIKISELNSTIDTLATQNKEQFYLEVLAKPAKKAERI